MFLSAQSFADLKGKGLLCAIKKPYDMYWAFEFKKSMKYKAWTIERTGDKFELTHSKAKEYQMNSSNIIIEFDGFLDGIPHRINRKTLKLSEGDYQRGTCRVSSNYKEVIEGLKKVRDKLQRDYDAEKEGNKI